MGLISLRNCRGEVVAHTKVDDEDLPFLNQHDWKLSKAGLGYAIRYEQIAGRQRLILLHRELLSVSPNREVDHKNHDGLDNRRMNLRVATHGENHQNRRIHKNNKSGVRGVWWLKSKRRWIAQVRLDGHKVFCRRYRTVVAAAEAVVAARRQFLPFALD